MRLYRSTAICKVADGYMSAILRHSDFGGSTNGVHLVLWRGFEASFTVPSLRLPRVLKHFVDAAAKGGFRAIDAPPALPPGVACKPTVVDGMGRIEGLYDMCHPHQEYAIPCVFKSTGWALRKLTPKEWLSVFDVPVHMHSALESEAGARGDIALSLSPLIAGFLFQAFWGNDEGGGGDGQPSSAESTSSNVREIGQHDRVEQKSQVGTEVNLQRKWDGKMEDDLQRIIKEQHDLAKAVKADDAVVPVHLWDVRILRRAASSQEAGALERIRQFGMRVYRRRLLTDCVKYLDGTHGNEWRNGRTRSLKVQADVEAIAEIIWRAAGNNWWDYASGSRLHFFRFPKRYRLLARDGVPNFFMKPGPTQRLPQPQPTPEATEVLKEKMAKMIVRKYITQPTSKLLSLIKYFAVPKGEGDWRVVYHAGANGLNDCVWAPSFYLPTVEALLRIVDHTSFMEDRDIGEMFLNFELHPNTCKFVGVDVRPLGLGHLVGSSNWLGWTKNLMGFRSSPYNSVKMFLICEEIIRGDRRDVNNAFQWDHVKLNLPGTANYNPSEGWLTKRQLDGTLASDMVTFVDDERVTGSGAERVREAGHTLSTRESYLGVQDALRKLRPAMRQPGAWAGVVVHNDAEDGIVVLTSQGKWDRTKVICQHWYRVLLEGKTELPFKQLESDRGFLVYVANAYPAMKPYLKGFHLSLEMWRGGQNEEGWKIKERCEGAEERRMVAQLDGDSLFGLSLRDEKGFVSERGPPSGMTPVVPRLMTDLEALILLTDSPTPAKRVYRRRDLVMAVYGFGDASSGGFGSSIGLTEGVRGRYGVWGKDLEDKSSNYRELRNLVEAVENEALSGRLRHAELWLFTDNSTAESCFAKGSSTSELLHELILKLRKLEMEVDLKLHLVHVAGTRMIAQGTDGLSRGMMCEGVMAGKDMLEYIDIARCSIERHPGIAEFIRKITGVSTLKPLSVEEWFVEGHGIVGGYRDQHQMWIPSHAPNNQIYWWDPPPVVADVALEEALKAKHKWSDAIHIFTIPRLCSPTWTRLFHKMSDFVVKLPVGSTHWPAGLHEPLFVGFSLPYIRYYPWSLRGTPVLVEMERNMHEVLGAGESDGGDILRQLLRLAGRISSVSESVARGLLRMPRKGQVPNVPGD
jgi:hypothetical protein